MRIKPYQLWVCIYAITHPDNSVTWLDLSTIIINTDISTLFCIDWIVIDAHTFINFNLCLNHTMGYGDNTGFQAMASWAVSPWQYPGKLLGFHWVAYSDWGISLIIKDSHVSLLEACSHLDLCMPQSDYVIQWIPHDIPDNCHGRSAPTPISWNSVSSPCFPIVGK